jgi:hypothetical protein
MIGFIDTPLQLQLIITAHIFNSFLTTSVWRISMKNLGLVSTLLSDSLAEPPLSLTHVSRVESSLMLRPTVSRPVYLEIKHSSGAYDQIFITVRQLRFCWCGALSLTRGRVYHLQLLLVLASAVILGSESHGTCDHILLSQIREFSFCRLLRLAGYGGGIWPRLHTGVAPDFTPVES